MSRCGESSWGSRCRSIERRCNAGLVTTHGGVPMFRDAEIATLVPQLVEALRMARENERVTYYMSQPQTSVKRIITSGAGSMSEAAIFTSF